MKKTIITTVTFLLIICNLSAQEENNSAIRKNEFSFSAGAGYAYMVDGIAGLSNLSKSYNNKMRFGLDYNFQAEYRYHRFTVGLMASVFNSKGATEFTSDNIFVNNYILQYGIYWFVPELHKLSLKTTFGTGITTYTNNSKVLGNKRDISEETLFTLNLNVETAYRLSKNWAIALNVMLIGSGKCRFNVNYHDETFNVRKNLPLSKVGLSAVIKYTL